MSTTKTTIANQNEFEALTQVFTDGIYVGHTNYVANFEFSIQDLHFLNINFSNCEFKSNASFRNTIFKSDVSFENAVFEEDVDFTNTQFLGKVRFHKTVFKGKVEFSNTKFKDLADFWKAQFLHSTIFYKCDFLGITVFSATVFSENVLFTYSLINKTLILRDTIFHKGLDLSLTIGEGQIATFNLSLSEYDDVPDLPNSMVDEYEQYVSEKAIITRKNQRETYRIIKNELRKQNNNIDALKYHVLESKVYYKHLQTNWRNSTQDFIVFWLNLKSNHYKQSWLLGLWFTFRGGLLFFYLAMLNTQYFEIGIDSTSLESLEIGFKYFLEFLLPTHSLGYAEELKPNNWSYLWDFIGRIFIGYGIYQTIQAFRRFKDH